MQGPEGPLRRTDEAGARDTDLHAERTIRRCGWLQLVMFLLLIPISYGAAIVYPSHLEQPREAASFLAMSERLAWLPGPVYVVVQDLLMGRSSPASPRVMWLIYAVALLALSAGFLVALRAVGSASRESHARLLPRLRRFSVAFAAVCVPAYPVFTQDMWLSIAWGRMIARGVNPYYEAFTPESLAGLPLDADPVALMSYGPLRGILSAVLSFVAGGAVVLEFLIVKVVLAGMLVLCLRLVEMLAREVDGASPAIAVFIFGWMPLAPLLTVAEGHNDVAMVLAMTAWLLLLLRGRIGSPFALAASILVKYVTLPLATVELLHALRSRRVRRAAYWLAAAGALAAGGLLVAAFARDTAFLDATRQMRDWRFLTPARAIYLVLDALNLPMAETAGALAALVVFAAAVVLAARRELLRSSAGGTVDLVLAIQALVLMTATGHVWPWFLLWVLGLCCLRPGTYLSRYLLSIALFAPLLHLFWIVSPGWHGARFVSASLYLCAMAVAVALRHLLQPSLERGADPDLSRAGTG